MERVQVMQEVLYRQELMESDVPTIVPNGWERESNNRQTGLETGLECIFSALLLPFSLLPNYCY